MAAGPAPASPPPSHVPPPPGYQVPPPPGPVAGAGAGPTGGGRRAWPWLLAASVVVALVLAVGVALVGWPMLREARQTPEAPQAVPTPAQALPTPTPGPEGTPDPDEPRLRPVEPVSVIGPTYGVNEDTFTMSFRDWPFAFRTPLPWNCFAGEWETVPEALAWVCGGESGGQQRLHVVLWECATTCTDTEQEEMLGTWLDDPERAVRVGSDPTAYVEIHPNEDDLYQVDLGHFGGEKQGELQWLVGIFVESPFDTRDDVLKILNDIVAQATA